MKSNQVNDERLINQRRKINGEAYSLIMIFLISSVLVKQFILNAEFEEYAVEFIAFFGSSMYIIIRNIFVGNDFYVGTKRSLPIINSIAIAVGTTFATVFLDYKDFNSAKDFILESITAFISSGLTAFIFFCIINRITQKRIRHIEKEYDEDNE